MSSVWKTSYASDTIPEIMVKIIGSKHYRYLVEKPNIKENVNLKAEAESLLQNSILGNTMQMNRAPENPADHQNNNEPKKEKESKCLESSQKSENIQHQRQPTEWHGRRFLNDRIPNQVNVHCRSVPSGDQTLSYIHALPRKNLRDLSLEQMVRDGPDQSEDAVQRTSGTTREDTFLLALVQREIKACPLSSNLLVKLQKELKILDPVSTGFLLQSQLSRLFLRLEVPLQLPTIKILCQRFSKQDSPEMVNYEKLLWFLKAATSNDPQQSKGFVDNDLRKTQANELQIQRSNPQDTSSQSKVNKSLVEVLKMALRATNGKLNLENLSLSFRKEDRSFSGYLPPPKIRAICGKHGISLTLSLLETLLNHPDLGYRNEIKWQSFVELLSMASSDLSSDLSTGRKGKETQATVMTPEEPEMPQIKTETMETPKEQQQPEKVLVESSMTKDPMNSLKMRPVSQPPVSSIKKSEESVTWMDRFRKLENALYLCDPSNTGVLERERAKRLIHNYNLIYNLSLSPRKIDQALRRFRAGENMLLEPALRYLKEL